MEKFSSIKILKLVKWITKHAFLVFLFLFFLSFILGGILFYKYGVLVQQAEQDFKVALPNFKEDLYRDILEEWQIRREIFEGAENKEYPNPFRID